MTTRYSKKKQYIDLPLDDESETMDEISTTDSAEGYETPNAFGTLDDKYIEMLGYKKVPKKKRKTVSASPLPSTSESLFKQISKEMYISEVSYKDYKNDNTITSKKKINTAISEISKHLFKIERIISQNNKLKEEEGIDTSQYWVSSQYKLGKIAERLVSVSRHLKKISK